MTAPAILLCSKCHTRVSSAAQSAACPACGGALIADTHSIPDPPGTASAEVDHRGIVLPRRHAVGGVITPR